MSAIVMNRFEQDVSYQIPVVRSVKQADAPRKLLKLVINLVFLAIFLFLKGVFSPVNAQEIRFQPRSTGVEQADIDDFFLLRLNSDQFSTRIISQTPPKSAKLAVRDEACQIAINANYFDPELKPLGLVISDGKVIQKEHKGGKLLTGFFVIQNQRPLIFERSKIVDQSSITEAVQAGPLLILNGEIVPIKERAEGTRRSAIAVTRNKKLILLVTKSRFPGATLEKVQHVLATPELEVTDALNLDGGGSSQLFAAKERRFEELNFSGGDAVPVLLCFKKKK